MAQKRNYLLGYGERLVAPIAPPKKRGEKSNPYTFEEARASVRSLATKASFLLDSLPQAACPDDEAVALLTLHPTYIAKSHHPSDLLYAAGIRAIGSRQREITPKKWSIQEHPETAITAEMFVAGPRKAFRDWAGTLDKWTEDTRGAKDLLKIEDFRAPVDRIRPITSKDSAPLLEVVLHASGADNSSYILDGFREYMRSLGIEVNLDRRIHTGGLCFLPVRVPLEALDELSKFSFLRVAREMPSLRQFRPILRSISGVKAFPCSLPKSGPIDPTIRVAVFDGGLSETTNLGLWATERTLFKIKDPLPEFQEHGLAVTSALLFGPLEQGQDPPTPYAHVDHYRVLDSDTGNDPQGEYYDVLLRIKSVLEQRPYEYIGLSLGPEQAIEDDDVHSWTAVLDPFFSTGRILPSIAVGNNGEGDRELGLARIQTPADCVNGLSIGAADRVDGGWQRASYSCIGPGRSPGRVKPDALAFGGTIRNPYFVLDANRPYHSMPILGTSFAAPTALRTAIGVRAHLGTVISPLAVKALLLHRCDFIDHDPVEVGWGRIPMSVDSIIECEEGAAHVIYQGKIDPAQWIRAQIPLPAGRLEGDIIIGATVCIATDTDPHEPFNYTRSGLDIVFRPNSKRRKADATNANSKPFFSSDENYKSESDLRSGIKWETTMSAFRTFKSNTLDNPVFDIHYNARIGGGPTTSAKSIPYALVVTVRSHEMPDLYDRIVKKYRSQLEVLRPVINIPVRT